MKHLGQMWANLLVVLATVLLTPAGWIGLLFLALVVHAMRGGSH